MNKKVILGIIVIGLLAGGIILGRSMVSQKDNDVIITQKEENENNETNVVPQNEEKKEEKEQVKENENKEEEKENEKKQPKEETKFVDITKVTKSGNKFLVTVQEYELYTLSEKEVQKLKNGGTLRLPNLKDDEYSDVKFKSNLNSENGEYYIIKLDNTYYLNRTVQMGSVYRIKSGEKTYTVNSDMPIYIGEMKTVYTSLELLAEEKLNKPAENITGLPFIINISNNEIISIYKSGV